MSGIHTGGVLGIHTGGVSGIHTGGVLGIHTGGVTGIHTGGVSGIHTGGVTGIHTGGVTGIHTGGVLGIHTGGVTGIHTGGVTGIHTGGVSGIHTGGALGIHTGGVTGIHTGGVAGIHTGGAAGIHTGGVAGIHTGGVNDVESSLVLAGPVGSIDLESGLVRALGQTISVSRDMIDRVNTGDFVTVYGSVVGQGYLYADSIEVALEPYVPGASEIVVAGMPQDVDLLTGTAMIGDMEVDYTPALSMGTAPESGLVTFRGYQFDLKSNYMVGMALD